MSARAAARLEYLGFQKVYRYTPAKADWLAAGFPTEGEQAKQSRIKDAVQSIPTCGPDERIGTVKQRLTDARVCAVVDKNDVVLGLLEKDAWKADAQTPAQEVMTLSPVSFRPDRSIQYARDYLKEHQFEKTLVTNSDGQLIGLALRSDVEELARKDDQAA